MARWQPLRIPLIERTVLNELAERAGKTDEEFITELIRRAAVRHAASTAADVEASVSMGAKATDDAAE